MPGGGVEPDEDTSVTAVREVQEEAGVVGVLGRCLGVFENREHKHRTKVFVMLVTAELEDWEDFRQIGRKRQWFTIDDALVQLARHKPVQRHYLQQMRYSKKLGRNLSNSPADGSEDSIFRHDDVDCIRQEDDDAGEEDAELKRSAGGRDDEGDGGPRTTGGGSEDA